jgi:CheY-like chemotaxis protein
MFLLVWPRRDLLQVLERVRDIQFVITDINMPGSMDGLRLAAAIRERYGRFDQDRVADLALGFAGKVLRYDARAYEGYQFAREPKRERCNGARADQYRPGQTGDGSFSLCPIENKASSLSQLYSVKL